jgi:hypothetical protein
MDPPTGNLFAGIRETQLGDARANGREVGRHRLRADRLACLWGKSAAEAQPIDQEVAEAGFMVLDSTEGWGLSMLVTESNPHLEVMESGMSSFGHNSGVCGLQRSVEIRA